MSGWQVPEHEVEITAVRSQGAGGQNVNKVSSAAQLRFDIRSSSLPDAVKQRLLAFRDHRITREGVVVIKSQQHRSLDQNRTEALARLAEMIRQAAIPPRKRVPTKTPRSSKRKRLEDKTRRSQIKQLRSRVGD